MIICTRRAMPTMTRNRIALDTRMNARRDALIRERMRLSRRSFDRGLAGDFRAMRNGGPRRLLPLV